MKKLLLILSIALTGCGPSNEDLIKINLRRQLDVAIRQGRIVRDAMELRDKGLPYDSLRTVIMNMDDTLKVLNIELDIIRL